MRKPVSLSGTMTYDAIQLPPLLIDIARDVRRLIMNALAEGACIHEGNVLPILFDAFPHVSPSDLRTALVVAGLAAQFPRATRG
jgi:hypothetical protein